LLLTLFAAFALGLLTASPGRAELRGFAWLDTIQARLDASQPVLAESLAHRALRESEADSGLGTLSIGRLSRLLGVAMHRQRGATYDRTWPPFELAGELISRHLGRQSIEYGGVLATQAAVLGGFGRVDESIAKANAAIALFEHQPAPLDSLVIRPLQALGGVLGHAGRPAEARPAFERAVAAVLRMTPVDSLRAAVLRCDAALAATQDGDLLAAEAMLDASGRVIEAQLDPADPDRIRYVTIRLSLLRRTADLLGQLELLDPMIAQFEKRKQPDINLARRLDERAVVYSRLGEESLALKDMARTAALNEAMYGLQNGTTINSHFEYAQLLDRAGESAQADSVFDRAMRAASEFEKKPGAYTAFGYASLGARQYAKKQYVAARASFEQAAVLQEASQGPLALDLGATLIELARVTAELGRVDTTHVLAERARRILLTKRSPEHPDLGDILGQEAWAEARAGSPVKAWDLALSAAANHQQHMRLVQPGLPEQQALELARSCRYRLAIALAMAHERAAAAPQQDAARVRATWEALMLARGSVLEQIAQRRHTLHSGAAARSADSLYRLTSNRYARLLVSRSGSEASQDPALLRARAEFESAERAWARASGERRGAQESGAGRLARLRARLTPRQAVVGIALHEEVAGYPAGYVAFVTRAGHNEVTVVPLGEAAAMDSLIDGWRSAFDLRHAASPESLSAKERQALTAGVALRARWWDPIARALGDVRQVFIVPDGALQLVNPAALPDAKGGYLIDSGPTFILLTRELDLLSAAPSTRAANDLLAIGAPDFDRAGDETPRVAAAFRGTTEACPRFRDLRFGPLPATGDELRMIAVARPGAVTLTGARADEASFKREAPRYRTVHLATHGFFLGEGCVGSASGRGIGGLAVTDTAQTPRGSARRSQLRDAMTSPMRLSGLALAGANHRVDADEAHEDGILTAEEIAALDLSGVERVVLSACHSGVGDVLTGEGVTGLRRAFRVAGVREQVMSLWDVDDRAAAQWMVALHRQWAAGATTAEAVRAAGRERLAARRAAGLSTHPAYWGAFVAVGDPR